MEKKDISLMKNPKLPYGKEVKPYDYLMKKNRFQTGFPLSNDSGRTGIAPAGGSFKEEDPEDEDKINEKGSRARRFLNNNIKEESININHPMYIHGKECAQQFTYVPNFKNDDEKRHWEAGYKDGKQNITENIKVWAIYRDEKTYTVLTGNKKPEPAFQGQNVELLGTVKDVDDWNKKTNNGWKIGKVSLNDFRKIFK